MDWKHIWHFTDGHWIDVSNLIPNDITDISLSGISMVSADDGWVVGVGGVILHYDGKVWKQMESPIASTDSHPWVDITAVSMVSANEGWAVGNWDKGSFILHYAGGKWTLTDGNVKNANLTALAMSSPNEGWAAYSIAGRNVSVGNVTAVIQGGAALLHYHSGRWTTVRIPSFPPIGQISMVSPDDGWALTSDGLLDYHDGVWELVSL